MTDKIEEKWHGIDGQPRTKALKIMDEIEGEFNKQNNILTTIFK